MSPMFKDLLRGHLNSQQNGTFMLFKTENIKHQVTKILEHLYFNGATTKAKAETADARWHFSPLPVPKRVLRGRLITLIALCSLFIGGDVQTKCVPGNMARADSLIFKSCLSALQKKKANNKQTNKETSSSANLKSSLAVASNSRK